MSHAGHSSARKWTVALAAASAVLVITGLTIQSSEAQPSALTRLGGAVQPSALTGGVRTAKAIHTFPHRTRDGQAFETRFDGKDFHAVTAGGAPLRDGDYKLDNGGAIKVRGGLVVWDAFGAVDVFKRTGLVKGVSPDG